MGRLTKCPDCSHKVSKMAEACPSCGRPLGSGTATATKKAPRRSSGCALIFLLVFFGSIYQFAIKPELDKAATDQARRDKATAERSGIGTDRDLEESSVPYEVIQSQASPPHKRSVDIRLRDRATEEELRVIARLVRSKDARSFRRTFICYYLPGQQPGHGAYATTHFDPDLKVVILGLSRSDAAELLKPSPARGRTIEGQWIDDSPMVGGKVILFEKGGKWFVEQTFKDGGVLETEVTLQETASGRRLTPRETNPAFDHWRILPNGQLEIRDKDGLIAVAQPIP